MSTRQVKVDIISDIICPFCLLGQKQLQTAVTKFNTAHPSTLIQPHVTFLPYQLNPDLSSTEPKSKAEMYEKKFGPGYKGMRQQMADRFTAHGLSLHPAGEVSSSHLGHRLQTLAHHRIPDKQADLAEDLFIAYHTDGIHPSDIPTLARLGVKYGLFSSEAEAKEWLAGKEYDEEVKKGYGRARSMGVTGVPFFIFEDKWAISGAVGEEAFVNFFEKTFAGQDTENGTQKTANKEGGAACT